MTISSELVWCNAINDSPRIPSCIRPERDKNDQAVGTPFEVLAEIAGRTCYDSFGHGRDSASFHDNIKKQGHLSIYRHCVFTVAIRKMTPQISESLIGQPGVWGCRTENEYRLTLNAQTVLDWIHNHHPMYPHVLPIAAKLMPFVFRYPLPAWTTNMCRYVKPRHLSEITYTFMLVGSRGFSHEMVRHSYQCAPSQRSTRYCEEGSITLHPILNYEKVTVDDGSFMHYWAVIDDLTKKGYTRKQARGAAREVLPTALTTHLLFTATAEQWARIFRQRISPFADDQIRIIMELTREQIDVLKSPGIS